MKIHKLGVALFMWFCMFMIFIVTPLALIWSVFSVLTADTSVLIRLVMLCPILLGFITLLIYGPLIWREWMESSDDENTLL